MCVAMEQASADLAARFATLESALVSERSRTQQLQHQAIVEQSRTEQLEAGLSSLPSASTTTAQTTGSTTDASKLIDVKTFGKPKSFNGDRIGWREFYVAFSLVFNATLVHGSYLELSRSLYFYVCAT